MNKEILEHVGPQTLAIIWLTKSRLSFNTPHFNTFNYLFNGILQEKNDNEMSIFEGSNFNHKFFLLHSPLFEKTDSYIKTFNKLIKPYSFEGNKILVTSHKFDQQINKLLLVPADFLNLSY